VQDQTGRPTREAPKPRGTVVAISGRNQLRGFVDEVRLAGVLAQVTLRIGDQRLTAVITRDAVDELQLKRGDEATAIIKATEVMLAIEADASEARQSSRKTPRDVRPPRSPRRSGSSR
jgi:molybdopterin-binding protein